MVGEKEWKRSTGDGVVKEVRREMGTLGKGAKRRGRETR